MVSRPFQTCVFVDSMGSFLSRWTLEHLTWCITSKTFVLTFLLLDVSQSSKIKISQNASRMFTSQTKTSKLHNSVSFCHSKRYLWVTQRVISHWSNKIQEVKWFKCLKSKVSHLYSAHWPWDDPAFPGSENYGKVTQFSKFFKMRTLLDRYIQVIRP